ncbi:MAG: LacI family DNA-binding transcriptional regulator [Propionibacteriaceae bacterium]|nr:LacI family DNA-binding transcriptional regulator [Propionibacteriaceae bacterium]
MATTPMKMSDLALHAGVSTATVSRVLSGKAGVRQTTRDTVLTAMEELGYSRDKQVTTKTEIVAILVPELSNPSFPAFAEELDTLLFSAGHANIVCAAGSAGTSEVQHLETLQDLNIAGLISVSGTPADTLASNEPYRRLISAGVPSVFINGYDSELDGAFFSCSDHEAVAASVLHLQSLGHTRIGLAVGPERYLPTQRKIAAFLSLGFSREDIASTIYTPEGGQLAAARLVDSGHTAIVCGSDIMALGAIREIRSLGLDVPDDISIVGFDDSPLMAFTDPALTTVRQPVRAMCEAAVTALLAALKGAELDRTELLFHPDLIIRNSTGPVS